MGRLDDSMYTPPVWSVVALLPPRAAGPRVDAVVVVVACLGQKCKKKDRDAPEAILYLGTLVFLVLPDP